MNRYALTEALQQLDAQYAHWVANLKIYGAFDPRTREQNAYYRGRLAHRSDFVRLGRVISISCATSSARTVYISRGGDPGHDRIHDIMFARDVLVADSAWLGASVCPHQSDKRR